MSNELPEVRYNLALTRPLRIPLGKSRFINISIDKQVTEKEVRALYESPEEKE